jgi:hypothetical protein
MQIKAKLNDIGRAESGRYLISLEMIEGNIGEFEKYKDKELAVDLKQWRNKRSLNANALLWACIGQIAEAIPAADKWDIYIRLLRRYGQFCYVEMPAEALPRFKEIYRECEVVGSRYTDGGDILNVLCYYGSSTYNTKEFSLLLDGVIEEMREMELETPTSADVQAALDLWETEHDKINNPS